MFENLTIYLYTFEDHLTIIPLGLHIDIFGLHTHNLIRCQNIEQVYITSDLKWINVHIKRFLAVNWKAYPMYW